MINIAKRLFWSSLSDKAFTKFVYKRQFKRKLDLEAPKSLNEKILWLKLYNRDPKQIICADKYKVREYISSKIGKQYLIELLGVYNEPQDLTIDNLPNVPFIIKANHTSGTFKIVRNKKDIEIDSLIKETGGWLKQNYYHIAREWQYDKIEPCIIVERLLVDAEGNIPSDIKFICINGKVEMINVDSNKEIKHLRNNYDRDWNPLPFRWPEEYHPARNQSKPKKLDKLIELSEKLASDFDFVRVDFYILNDKIYFGELTFHPTSGLGNFSDYEYDLMYGDKLKITNKSIVDN